MATTEHVPENFCSKEFRTRKGLPCPICEKTDWCLTDGATWAICKRIESQQIWGNAGWFHRLGENGNNPTAHPTPRPAPAKAAPDENKIWPSLKQAAIEFDQLPLALENPAALKTYEQEYGLPAAIIPDWFRVFNYPKLGHGVVVPGINPAGETVCYKYKSFSRDAKGKRQSRYLCGGGGALVLPSTHPDAPVVVTGGEEKALAAFLAGYHALSPLTGEAPLGVEWIAKLTQTPRREIIVANDNDEAGEKATSGTISALLAAGYPASRVKLIVWPPGMPVQGDLSDILKTSGVEGVQLLVAEAQTTEKPDPWISRTLADAFNPRPPISYLVNPLLRHNSLSLIVGASGSLKTMLCMDLAISVALGRPWLCPFEASPASAFPVEQSPVVWLNVDTPTETLDERFAAIARAYRVEMDIPLRYYSFPSPGLIATNSAAMSALRTRLTNFQARLLIVDCLQQVRGDIEENSSEMGLVILPFRELAEHCGCSVILIHHINKAGGFRGSTSIENLVDLLLCVERDGHSPDISIIPGKVRHEDIRPFSASFIYQHKPDTTELLSAQFAGLKPTRLDESIEVKEAIIEILTQKPSLNLTQIFTEIVSRFQESRLPGKHRIRGTLESLKQKGIIIETSGLRREKFFSLPYKYQHHTHSNFQTS